MNRRQREREKQREFERRVAEQRAERARLDALRERGAFIMEADEYTLSLIEQFGVTALWFQRRENEEAYRMEVRRWQQQHVRRTFADALALAAKQTSPSFRIVLYNGECEGWRTEEYRREVAARRKRALADLAKLGISGPNASGDGA